MRQTWRVLWTSPTLVCPRVRKLINGHICRRVGKLFCRQAGEGVSDQNRLWAMEATAGVRGVVPGRQRPQGLENRMRVELDGRRGDLPRQAGQGSSSQHHLQDG